MDMSLSAKNIAILNGMNLKTRSKERVFLTELCEGMSGVETEDEISLTFWRLTLSSSFTTHAHFSSFFHSVISG